MHTTVLGHNAAHRSWTLLYDFIWRHTEFLFVRLCTKKIVASCITEVFGAMLVEDNIPNITNPTEPPCYDTQSLCGFSLQRRPLALCMRPNGNGRNINRQRKGFF